LFYHRGLAGPLLEVVPCRRVKKVVYDKVAGVLKGGETDLGASYRVIFQGTQGLAAASVTLR